MDISKLRVAELRQELQKRDLDTSSRKAVLLARLKLALNAEQAGDEIGGHIGIVRVDNSNGGNDELICDNDVEIAVINNDIMSTDSETGIHSGNGFMRAYDIIDSVDLTGNNSDNDESIDVHMSGVYNNIMNTDGAINSDDVASATIDAKKVNYVLMTGKRLKSELLYLKDEQQFYHKNRVLANGIVSYDCAQKHKNKCNRHVHLDRTKEECFYQIL